MEEAATASRVEWADAELYCPYPFEQALLYEHAAINGTRAFLKMVDLPFNIEPRPNAEYMAPSNVVPFLRLQNTLVPGFSAIVELVAQKGITLTNTLNEAEIADMNALMSLIFDNLVRAETYFCWKDAETYNAVTRHRYGSVYHFPLNWLLPPLKRREALAQLACTDWLRLSAEEVIRRADAAFTALSIKLGNRRYLMGTEPTELDALAFGHCYSILTTELPASAMHLANALRKYPNLVKFCCDIDNELFKI